MPPPGERARRALFHADRRPVTQFPVKKLKRVLEGILVGEFEENLWVLTQGERPRFGLLDGRIYLLLAETSAPPAAGELQHELVLGERSEGTWRVLFENRAADGIPLLPDSPVRIVTDLPEGSALRFGSAAVRGVGAEEEEVTLSVRLDGELIHETTQLAALEPAVEYHEVVLPPGGERDAELLFELQGELAFGAVLHPVLGPAQRGSYGERPWTPDRPDVVLVVGDTYRADNLAAWGGDPAIAPNLNRFAHGARRFLGARAPATSTLPSHAALFTGLYPPQCGVLTGRQLLEEERTTLAEHFQAAGYRTVAITDAGFVSWQYGLSQGFESFEQSWTTAFCETLAATEEHLLADDGRPLFLFLHSYRAHNPYEASDEARERLRSRVRLAGVDWDTLSDPVVEILKSGARGEPLADSERVLGLFEDLYRAASLDLDDGMGSFLEMLERAELLEDAIVVFTSDHGEAFGEHGVLGHGTGVWEDEALVPLLIRAPGVEAGAVEATASLVDLPPTLAALADLPGHDEWVGRNLLDEGASDAPVFSFTATWRDELAEVAAIAGERKLILDAREGPGALLYAYQLDADPRERLDLCTQEWAEALRRRLATETAAIFVGPRSAAVPEVPPALREQLEGLGYGGAFEEELSAGAPPPGGK